MTPGDLWIPSPVLLVVAGGALHVTWLLVIRFSGVSRHTKRLTWLIVLSLVTTALAAGLPEEALRPAGSQMVAFLNQHEISEYTLLVLSLSAGLIFARYQRVWPFDEEWSFAAARHFARHGWRSFFHEYGNFAWLGKQHPPGIALAGGWIMKWTRPSLFAFRLLNVILGTATVYLTYHIARQFFPPHIALIAGFNLLMLPMFTRQMGAGLLEIPVVFFTSLTIYLAMAFPDVPGMPLLAGLLIGLGMWMKYTVGFAYLILAGFTLFARHSSFTIGDLLVAGLVTAVVFGIWIGVAVKNGWMGDQLTLIRKYIGAEHRDDGYKQRGWGFLGRNRLRYRLEMLMIRLPSATGLYFLPWILTGGLLMLTTHPNAGLLASIWIGVIAVALITTLPDHRYFLQLFPALAIVAAAGIATTPIALLRAVLLVVPLWAGTLYLYYDWDRQKHVFLKHLDSRKRTPVEAEA